MTRSGQSERRREATDAMTALEGAAGRTSPAGKQSLTQAKCSGAASPVDARYAGVAPALVQRRATREAVADVDAPKSESLMESRATIDADSVGGGLESRQLERARRRNPQLGQRHGVTPADLGAGGVASDSEEYAEFIAGLQREHGLSVDGIAGPETFAALGTGAGRKRRAHTGVDAPKSDSLMESRATIDPDEVMGPSGPGAGDELESDLLGVQFSAAAGVAASNEGIHAAAARGIAAPATQLPFLDRIQASFGDHDVGSVRAHVGGAARVASDAMGAEAFATGGDVAFREMPSLHTAAHEAAHVVQQRAGVQLKGGVGEAGDVFEKEADQVADLVVSGESAVPVLGKYGGNHPAPAPGSVQRNPGAGYPEISEATALMGGSAPNVPAGQRGETRDFPNGTDYPGISEALGLIGEPEPTPPIGQRGETCEPANGALPSEPDEATKSPPRIAASKIKVSAAAGGSGKLSDLYKGDLVEVTLTLDRRSWRKAPMHDELVGAGPQLEQVSSGWRGGNRYYFQLKATGKPGDIKPKLTLAFAGLDDVEFEFDARVLLDKEAFKARLGVAETYILESFAGVESLLEQAMLAYIDGWTRHTDVLKSQGKKERLADALIREALTAAIVGGLGGYVSHVLKTKAGLGGASGSNTLLVDGLKGVTKLLAKKGLAVDTVNVSAFAQFPPSPLQWKGNEKTIMLSEKMAALHTIRLCKEGLRDSSLKLSFDPEALYKEKLTINGCPIVDLPPVDIEATSRTFTKEFWKTWLMNYGHTVRSVVLPGAPQYTRYHVRENANDEIRAAIDALGVDGAIWLEVYGGVAKNRANREVDDRNRGLVRA